MDVSNAQGLQPLLQQRRLIDMQVLPAAQSTAFSPYRLEKVIGIYFPSGLADEMRVTSYLYHPSSLLNKGPIQRITEPDGAWHEYEYFRNIRVFCVKQGEAGLLPTDAAVDVQTVNYNLLKIQAEFTDERGNAAAGRRAVPAHVTRQPPMRAITRACERAFPHPTLDGVKTKLLTSDQLGELKAWRKSTSLVSQSIATFGRDAGAARIWTGGGASRPGILEGGRDSTLRGTRSRKRF